MKKWQKAVLAGVIVLALAGAAFFIYLRTYRLNSINQPKSYQTPETTPVEPANPAPAVYFPISGYSSRLTFRWFGKFVNNEPVSPCGANFRVTILPMI
jgi:hypothetical protein